MSIGERTEVDRISKELQALQRTRAWYLKSRIMVMNRLQATVAGTIGYHNGMTKAERRKVFAEAGKLIKLIQKGEVAHETYTIVMTTTGAINGFDEVKKSQEKEMLVLVKELPILQWVEHTNQRGFGLLMLGIIIGETGNLDNYANPAKLWRRMGCAPYTKSDETLMGASWKSRGGKTGKGLNKLKAVDWEEFGYSPRRRSIAFLIGEGLVKQNAEGPYRKRYIHGKVSSWDKHQHETKDDGWNWRDCLKCEGKGKISRKVCGTCGGTGKTCGHAHSHGMLLCTKLLLKNLWLEWRDDIAYEPWQEVV